MRIEDDDFEIIDHIPSYRRPIEGQVLGLENITIGRRFVHHCGSREAKPMTIIKPPFEKDGFIWAVVVYPQSSYPVTDKVSMSDRGVIPYGLQGSYNSLNYLKVDETPAPDRSELIDSFLKKKEFVAAGSIMLAAAVEASDPSKKFAYLKTFGDLLKIAGKKLEDFNLNLADIIAIVNIAYQRPMTQGESQKIHAMAVDALSSFPRV